MLARGNQRRDRLADGFCLRARLHEPLNLADTNLRRARGAAISYRVKANSLGEETGRGCDMSRHGL